MILNNRLGFPVTTEKKKIWKWHFAFAVNIFLRFWSIFFWKIKLSKIVYLLLVIWKCYYSEMRERWYLWRNYYLWKLSLWNHTFGGSLCFCVVFVILNKKKKKRAWKFTWNILVMNVFVLQPHFFPCSNHVWVQYLPELCYFSKVLMNRLKMHFHADIEDFLIIL